MNYGLSNDHLCSASRIETHFEDDIGTRKAGAGTAFLVKIKKGEICLVTNRHVVDLDYNHKTPKYKNFKLKQVLLHNNEKDTQTGLPTDSNDLLILNCNEFIYSDKYENDIACLRNIKALDIKGIPQPRVSCMQCPYLSRPNAKPGTAMCNPGKPLQFDNFR